MIISPRSSYWTENTFLAFLVERTRITNLTLVMNSDYVRWAVTALGIINLILGIWEAIHFRDLVRLMVGDKDASSGTTATLSDNGV